MHTAEEIITMTPKEKWEKLEALLARKYGYPDERGTPEKMRLDLGRHPNTFYQWRKHPDKIDPLAIIALERMTLEAEEVSAIRFKLLSEISDDLAAIAVKLADLARALRP